jgi:hypothetical protein
MAVLVNGLGFYTLPRTLPESLNVLLYGRRSSTQPSLASGLQNTGGRASSTRIRVRT